MKPPEIPELHRRRIEEVFRDIHERGFFAFEPDWVKAAYPPDVWNWWVEVCDEMGSVAVSIKPTLLDATQTIHERIKQLTPRRRQL